MLLFLGLPLAGGMHIGRTSCMENKLCRLIVMRIKAKVGRGTFFR